MITLADLRAAADRVAGRVVRTPLIPAPWAMDQDRPLYLKPESLQPTGAFKLRGAFNALGALTDAERTKGVVAHSSGNHAQAVAYAARAHGVPAVIVIPYGASELKVRATEDLGADVVRVPPVDRLTTAERIRDERGMSMIPPFDHADVIAGQGTVGLEIIADLPDVATVLVPVSGGGLLAGVATAVRSLVPDGSVRVIGVEPELAADATESFRAGHPVGWSDDLTQRTIADGLRNSKVGALPFEHITAYVDDMLTVSEEEIIAATRQVITGSRLVCEPSGAVATAAYLFHADRLPSGPAVSVVSGGNLDLPLLQRILAGEGVALAG